MEIYIERALPRSNFHPNMSDTEKTETKPVAVPAEKEVVEPKSETKEEAKRVGDEVEKPKKKRRRRQYDDAPKDEPESDENDDKEEPEEENDDEEEDLLEIDEANIITTGRRTRGKVIDFKKAAEEIPEDDEEEDGEFEAKDEPEAA